MNYFLRIILAVITCLSNGALSAIECPDTKKVSSIIKELRQIIKEDVCVNEINGKQLEWISNTAIPQIMTKSFLGVEPPPNWRMMIDEITVGCYIKGDLCTKKVQEEFVQCTTAKMPIILFQISPWLSENCVKLNEALLKHWPEKKPIVLRLFNEFIQKSKNVSPAN